jgi:putative endonuclease
MFYVYMLYSPSLNKYYTGSTGNLNDRLFRHNHGRSKATKAGIPWILKYTESFTTRSEAVKREFNIKRMKSRKYIEALIDKKT